MSKARNRSLMAVILDLHDLVATYLLFGAALVAWKVVPTEAEQRTPIYGYGS